MNSGAWKCASRNARIYFPAVREIVPPNSGDNELIRYDARDRPCGRLFPEMIAMVVWRPDPTPYGAYPNAESTELPMSERPVAEDDPPAISAIGSIGRFLAGLGWVPIEPELGWVPVEPEASPLGRHDGIDWDRAGSAL